MESTRLLELAATITTAVNAIHSHLTDQNLPYPSFEPGAPTALPEELASSQNALIDAISEISDLVIGPVDAMTSGSSQNYVSLSVIRRFNIANSFVPGEERTFAQISADTGLSRSMVKRILRHAMTFRVFKEPREGVVAHTARSALLRSQEAVDFIAVGLEEMDPAALRAAEALQKWPGSEEPNHTGFALVNRTDIPTYKVLEGDPARAARFANTMSIMTNGKGFDVSHVVNGYDWSALNSATVVDIGGSRGHIAQAVASRFPSLSFVVQDLPSTVANAAADLPPQLVGRVSFMPHDFFNDQPVVADAYFLRWILHNWPDKYCVKILRALIPALRPGARIIINEICVPQPGCIPLWREKQLRTMDMGMMTLFNAQERDADEWRDLLERADPRFTFAGIHQAEGSQLALIEAVWWE
ncbi:hypothetical protein APSETT444_000859 [Aspergillus pseudonomiae]